MFHRILVASDGSGPSMRGARLAALVAKALSAEVTVLTVASLPEQYKDDLCDEMEDGYIDEWKQALDATTREVRRGGIEPTTRFVREGNVVDAVLAELKSGGHDLLIIGRTGSGNAASKTMGSASDRLTSLVACSIMVIR
jgi:nucleotide-binding universal stress UspA family protein